MLCKNCAEQAQKYARQGLEIELRKFGNYASYKNLMRLVPEYFKLDSH